MAVAMLLVSAASVRAFAHHSFAMFDMQQSLTIEGTVKDYQWTNPHVWIDLLVADPATHQPVLWSVEANSIAVQSRMGWTRHSLHAGDMTTLVIHPLRKGTNGGSLMSGSVNGKPIGNEPERK
ncbi:MAG TPA: DUF6152 family protein [Dyella sp.]|uniref:DUF6152 family protein n=1 Tax=Dyella sp. TaxID=1869338 RepID=UPI002D7817BD|nr:DUF6152 family protein [Dyella sp.]HET6554683.1 DUF6152 family protein [Dyella sp.]